MLDELEFRDRADESLHALYKKLGAASEDADFEADFNNGALTIEFDESPVRFVISPNSPVRQIWVSAHSKSFKLGWDSARNTFILPDSGETLTDLIQSAIRRQLGEEITL